MSTLNVVAIKAWIIDLGNENDVRILAFDLRQSPLPELHGHHFGHIATESVDALRGPIEQDLQHLVPRIWSRGEVTLPATKIIDAVVELHSLIPIVLRRPRSEIIVTRSLRRNFFISRVGQDVVEMQLLCRKVIEVVIR